MADAYNIRTMEPNEVAFAVDLAAKEGWNPGIHDAACFYAADPGGYFICELENRPIGCVSAVAYGQSFGFIGLYIVVPDMRGKGFGMKLWNKAMARLEGRNIGLDSVLVQQDNYRKSGFRRAYKNMRRQTTAKGGPHPSALPLDRFRFEEVAAYDRLYFPEQRDDFLKAWLAQSDSAAFGLDRGGSLAGYGVIRKCGLGWKIGPLFADDSSGAQELFNALTSTVVGRTVFLDVPEPNSEAFALSEKNSMTTVFETARMYTGPDPDITVNGIFGVTTFELG